MDRISFLIATPSVNLGEYTGKVVSNYYNCNVYFAKDGWSAYSIVKNYDIDVAVVSLIMPRVSGFEIIKAIREKERKKNTTCIVSSIYEEDECNPFYYTYTIGIYGGRISEIPVSVLKKIIDVGIDDIISEPVNSMEILLMKVQTAIRIAAFQKRNKLLFKDINEKGSIDPLCMISNRQTALNQIDKRLCESIVKKTAVALFMLDLDYFKNVNDTYGHQVGDTVLREFAQSVKKNCCRSSDVIGRYGGEEFIVVTPIDNTEEKDVRKIANSIADKILKSTRELSIKTPEGDVVKITCSIGGTVVTPYKMVGDDLEQFCFSIDSLRESMTKVADLALYDAKNKGRNRFIYRDFTTNI